MFGWIIICLMSWDTSIMNWTDFFSSVKGNSYLGCDLAAPTTVTSKIWNRGVLWGVTFVTRTHHSVSRPIISLVVWFDQFSTNGTAISQANVSKVPSSARSSENLVPVWSKTILALISGFEFAFNAKSVPNRRACFESRFHGEQRFFSPIISGMSAFSIVETQLMTEICLKFRDIPWIIVIPRSVVRAATFLVLRFSHSDKPTPSKLKTSSVARHWTCYSDIGLFRGQILAVQECKKWGSCTK